MLQAHMDEVEALRLTNQRLIGELEQLTRQMQCPRDARQTQEAHNTTPQEGQPHLGSPGGAETEAEFSQARGHEPHLTPQEEGNEATHGDNVWIMLYIGTLSLLLLVCLREDNGLRFYE